MWADCTYVNARSFRRYLHWEHCFWAGVGREIYGLVLGLGAWPLLHHSTVPVVEPSLYRTGIVLCEPAMNLKYGGGISANCVGAMGDRPNNQNVWGRGPHKPLLPSAQSMQEIAQHFV